MNRLVLALAAVLIGLVPRGTEAASTIDPTLPVQGVPYNAAPIRDNFGAAANDINALLRMNSAASPPSSPALGTLWLQTPLSGTTYTQKLWDAVASAWVTVAALESTTGLWVPPVGGGTIPSIISAGTTNLGSVPQAAIFVTGNQTIASFGSSVPAGQMKFIVFTSTPTLVYNSTYLILPSGANTAVSVGQTAVALSLGGGRWQVIAGTIPGTTGCTLFSATTDGCVPAAGDDEDAFLRADGTWVNPGQTIVPTADLLGGAGGAFSLVTVGDGLALSGGTLSAPIFDEATQGEVPPSGGGAANFLRSDGSWAAPLDNIPQAVGWPAALDPNNVVLTGINHASTIAAIVGYVEVPVGAAATVSIYKAPSGTACSAGTVLHSGSFDANGTAATNQTLTVTTSSLLAGDRICLKTTGGANWTSGVGIGTITVFLAPS